MASAVAYAAAARLVRGTMTMVGMTDTNAQGVREVLFALANIVDEILKLETSGEAAHWSQDNWVGHLRNLHEDRINDSLTGSSDVFEYAPQPTSSSSDPSLMLSSDSTEATSSTQPSSSPPPGPAGWSPPVSPTPRRRRRE